MKRLAVVAAIVAGAIAMLFVDVTGDITIHVRPQWITPEAP